MSAVQATASRKRASWLAFICVIVVAFVSLSAIALAEQPDDVLSRDSVLHDAEIPPLGNPNGDLTVVEFFDYQCPYCKKMAPELAQLLREDGHIRLVLKDWPVFGPMSTAAAEIVLATKYQNKYAEAHDALIGADAKLTKASITDLLVKAGVDVDLAIKDLQAHQKTLDDLLARNEAQAEAFGFDGTPGFIVGTFRVPGVVEMNVFKQIVADARARAKKKRKS
ncbi:MAG: DsbA family protein [Xanthobacteraceae bacterium]